MNVMENYLMVGTPSGSMPVFAAAPESGKCPVMIVLQEAFGVNDHIKNVCRKFAREGFLALAPEIYHRKGQHITVPYGNREAIMPLLGTLSNEDILSDIRDVISFLPELSNADTSKVFTIGFCVGGFASLLAATELPLTGAVSFYGGGLVRPREGFHLKPFVENLPESHCPLLLFFGEQDASIPESDRFEVRRVLDENHVPHEMIVFGEADHGFFCDERKTFHPESARMAWEKTLNWLRNL
jgi:carboxymethylenebutenolidase